MNRSSSLPLVRSPSDENDLKKRKLSSAFRVNSSSSITLHSAVFTTSSDAWAFKSSDPTASYENSKEFGGLERNTSAFSCFLENNLISEVCIVCETPLDSFCEGEKEQHLNSCLDAKGVEKSNQHKGLEDKDLTERGLRCQEFYCVICDVNLSRRKLLDRCLHLKRCAKDHQMTTKQLLQFISPELDHEEDGEEEAGEEASGYQCAGRINGRSDGCNNNVISLLSEDEEDDRQDQLTRCSSSSTYEGAVTNALSVLMSNCKQQTFLLKGGGFEPKKKSTTASAVSKRMKAKNTPTKKSTLPPDLTITNPNKEVIEGNNLKSNIRRFSNYKKKNYGSGVGVSTKPGGSFAPAYKKIQIGEMTYPIVVDGFQYASSLLTDCYFLTHFHSDHYMGLSKDFDCGTRFVLIFLFLLSLILVFLSLGTIYCSPTTASLVKLKLKVATQYLVALELETKVHR
jgi:hypothetical protein